MVSLSTGETIWQFSGDALALATETQIPASSVVIAGPSASTLAGGTVSVYPLGNVGVTSVHEVCVAAWTSADWQPGQLLPAGVDVSAWGWTVVSGNLPAALWGARGSDTSPPMSSTVVSGVVGVTGTAQGVVTGGLTIGASILTTEETARGLPLPTTAIGGPGPTPTGDTRTQVTSTIDAAAVAALRGSVVAAAGTAGLSAGLVAGSLPLLVSEVYAVLASQPMVGPPGTTGPAAATASAPAPAPAAPAPAAPAPAAPAPAPAPPVASAPADAAAPANVAAAAVPALRALFQQSQDRAPAGTDPAGTATVPAAPRRAPRVSAVVADQWTSSAERRLLAPEDTAGPGAGAGAGAGAVRTIAPGSTVVWDLPLSGNRTLRHDGTAPLWIVAIDAAQHPRQVSGGMPDGPLPASASRVAVTALEAGGASTVTAGWHGGTALRQVASQVLLGDGSVVRPQSPHGVPLRRTRSAPSARSASAGRRAQRELGVVTGRRLVDRTWTQGGDGSVLRGWIETSLPPWCRAVLVGLLPAADGAELAAADGAESAAGPRLTIRRWQEDAGGDVMAPVSAAASQVDAAGPIGIEGRRLWLASIPDTAVPDAGGQLIVRAWAPAGWRLDGVYGLAAPPGGPVSWPPGRTGNRGIVGQRWNGTGVVGMSEATFYDSVTPALAPGDYQVIVQDTVTVAGESGTPASYASVQRFRVAGSRTNLGPGDVVAMSPPSGATGSYGLWLPHVILAQRTLPWQVPIAGGTSSTQGGPAQPWLALLLLTPQEIDVAGSTPAGGTRAPRPSC